MLFLITYTSELANESRYRRLVNGSKQGSLREREKEKERKKEKNVLMRSEDRKGQFSEMALIRALNCRTYVHTIAINLNRFQH